MLVDNRAKTNTRICGIELAYQRQHSWSLGACWTMARELPYRGTVQALLFLAAMIGLPNSTGFADDKTAQVKNVLFIVSDDLKASVLGCYGDEVCQTPNIDKLAQSGMLFRRAYCQGTWCAPSRQSFMFSRYQSGGSVSLGECFRKADFYSARVGKIFHMRVPGDIIAGTDGKDVPESWTERFNSSGQEAHTPGDYACLNLDIFTTDLANRQSTGMPHRPYVTVKIDGEGAEQPDFKSATKAIEILRARKEHDQPFLLAVGLIRPHYPMVAPRSFFERYPWQQIVMPDRRADDHHDIPPPGRGQSLSSQNKLALYPDNQKRMWTGYYASVSFMDQQVGKIVDELERLGLRESTAIVFTSDHGYHLGEHDFWQKSDLHEEVTRVPLLVAAPGFEPGVCDSPVELVDLYPTLTSLAGIDAPDDIQGKSLVPLLEDPKARVRDAALSIHRGYALRGDRWAYLRYANGGEELYDMSVDPEQFNNLVSSQGHERYLEENRAALDARIEREGLKGAKRKGK